VERHPWGPEALERARAEDRPILLSVGYSACHRCHVLEGLGSLLSEIPQAFGRLLAALDQDLGAPQEVEVVGEAGEPGTEALLGVRRGRYLPNTLAALRRPGEPEAEVVREIPVLAQRTLVDGRAAVYVCQRFACRRPVTEPAGLAAELA
jgi:uncharacterized protein